MRKNKFLTFMFSMLPGCGHMYLGYMKRGVQFMVMFAASTYLMFLFTGIWGNSYVIGVMFGICLPIIWFYQLFDAMHSVSHMRRFMIEFPGDDDGFFMPGISDAANAKALSVFKNRKTVKIIAGIIAGIGIYALMATVLGGVERILSANIHNYWHSVYYQTYRTVMNYLPPVVISLALIFSGIKLLVSKNESEQ